MFPLCSLVEAQNDLKFPPQPYDAASLLTMYFGEELVKSLRLTIAYGEKDGLTMLDEKLRSLNDGADSGN